MVPAYEKKGRPAFTKFELAVVIGIVALLMGVVTPLVLSQREKADRAQCTDNMKALGLACHNFESAHKRLPPLYGGVASEHDQASQKYSNVWGSTHFFLLPFMGEDAMWKSMASGDPLQFVPSMASGRVISTFLCPSDPSASASAGRGGTSYAANAQVFARLTDETLQGGGFMQRPPAPSYCDRGAPLSRLSDGSTNIILFIHAYSLCGAE